MQVIIFRHGISEVDGPDGTDFSRRLTDEGIEKTAMVANGLAAILGEADVVLHSPLIRAHQTAEIVADALGGELEVCEILAHGSNGEMVKDLKQRDEQVIVLVGHEPMLGELVSLLCTGSEDYDFSPLKKAGVACVEIFFDGFTDPDVGRLKWLLAPKVIRELTGGMDSA